MNEIKKRLQHASDWAELIRDLESEADAIEDRSDRSKRLYVLAQACEDLFLSKDRAMVNYQKAFKLLPKDVRPLVRARQIYREMGSLKMVAKLMDFQLKVVDDPSERAQLLIELALVYVDLGNIDGARVKVNEAQALDQTAMGLDEARATISFEDSARRELVGALRVEAGAANGQIICGEDPKERSLRSMLLVRAARIATLEGMDSKDVQQLLADALVLDPDCVAANSIYESLMADRGDLSEIRELHDRRVAAASDDQRIDLCRSLASLWASRFDDLATASHYYAQAVRAYYEGGEGLFVGHLAALRIIREALASGLTVDGVSSFAELLELIDLGLDAPLLDGDLSVLAALGGDVALKNLNDPTRAASYYAILDRLDPDHPGLIGFRAQHETLLGQVNEEDELAEEGEEETSFGAEESTRVVASEELAELVASSEDGEVPESETTEEEESASAAEETESLASVDGEAPGPSVEADQDSPDDIGDDVARVISTRDENESDASNTETSNTETRSEVTPTVPEEDSAEEEDVSVQEGGEAVTLAPLTPLDDEDVDEESAELFRAAAKATEESAERGIAAWRKAAQKNRKARTPRRALANLYEQAERWNQLVEVLKEEVSLTEDAREKRALLLKMSAVYDKHLRLDVMNVNVLNQALKTFSSEGDGNPFADEEEMIVDLLLEPYERMKRWSDLIGALRRKAGLVASSDEKVRIWSQIAQMFIERFSNQAEAIKAYEAILEVDPANPDALSALKSMYERRRDWDKLISVWEVEIESLTSDEERAKGYLDVARLATAKLKRPQVSMALWRRALEYMPDNAEALSHLGQIFERTRDWAELAEVCERQIEISKDNETRAALLLKLGALYTDKLPSEEAAIRSWRHLLEIDPENRRAQDALRKLYLDARAYDQLEAFYAQQNKWDEFIRVLERQVESEDPEMRIRLYFRIADLWANKLQKPERAARAFEKILALDEHNLAAAEALVPLYANGRDQRKYAQVLEIQLQQSEDVEQRGERASQLIHLLETEIRDPGRAFGWALQSFSWEPFDKERRDQVERLAAEIGAWPELVSAYETACRRDGEDQAGDEPASRECLPLLLTTARVYEHELVNLDAALKTNQEILEVEAQNPQALDALQRLYMRQENWDRLLDIYQRKIELLEDPEQRKDVLFRVAQLYDEELTDPERSIETYRSILDLGGDDPRALRRLNHIYQHQEKWHDLAETLLRELTLVDENDTKTLCELKYELGELYDNRLDDIPAAIESYREILSCESNHSGARIALEKYLRDEVHQLRVSTILQPIYEETEEWQKLIEIYEIRLAQAEDQAARVEILLKIGELFVSRVGDGDRAFDAFGRCFKLDPGNTNARAELERLAEIQDRLEDLAALYEEAVDQSGDSVLQHEILVKLASLMEERLEDADGAVRFYERAQDVDPQDIATLDALERLYAASERWADVLSIYERKVELAEDDNERRRLLSRIAYIWEEMEENLPEAVGAYQRVLALDEANEDALKALDRLYQAQELWEDLAANLTRQLALLDTEPESEDPSEEADSLRNDPVPRQVSFLLRLGGLREDKLDESALGIDAYREILAIDPENVAAVEALERLLQNDEFEPLVAGILKPYYKRCNQWQRLIDVNEVLVRHADDHRDRVPLLHEIGKIYEGPGRDPSAALAVYGRALQESPGLESTQNELDRLAGLLGSWNVVVDLYDKLVATLSDESIVIGLHTKIARIREEELHNADSAAKSYYQILDLDPEHLGSINALLRLFEQNNSYRELVDVLLKKSEIILDVSERKSILGRAAQILQNVLEESDRAVDVYQRILEIEPDDQASVQSLEVLYRELERWADLRDTYIRKVEIAESEEEKKSVFYLLGRLYQQELDDCESAIETYQAILDLEAGDMEALRALDRLYEGSDRWYDLLQNIESQFELSSDEKDRVELKYRSGRILEQHLQDTAQAIQTYREVLLSDATHGPAREALERIARAEGDSAADAANVLEPVYQENAEWNHLIALLGVVARQSDDPYRRREVLHRIADLQETKLGDVDEAFSTRSEALPTEGSDSQSFEHLERLAGVTGKWTELADLYEGFAAKLNDPVQESDISLMVARIAEERLGDPDRSISHYKRVIEGDPENAAALSALDRLYTATHDYAELVEIVKAEARIAEGADEILTLNFRLGELYREKLDDIPAAISSYRDVLVSAPEHKGSTAALEMLFDEEREQLAIADVLEPLYRMREAWSKLVPIMEVQFKHIHEPYEQIQAVQRLADIYERRLDEPEKALSWLLHGLSCDPAADMLADELERLAGKTGAWRELADAYATVAESAEASTQNRLFSASARIYRSAVQDVDRAERMALQVLNIDPENAESLKMLDGIYLERGDYQRLADILEQRIRGALSGDEEVELKLRLGEVFQGPQADLDRAVAAYRSVLDSDSRNARALDALEAIYFTEARWSELYEIYERMIDLAPGDDGVAECYSRMAKIASDALRDSEKARDLWNRVLDLRGEDQVALRAVADLYEAAGEWQDLVDVLDRQANLTEDEQTRAQLFHRLGRIWGEKLQRDRNALEMWQRVLEIDPRHVSTLSSTAEVFRRNESWPELVATLTSMIEIGEMDESSGLDVHSLYSQLGEVHAQMLHSPNEAIDAWRRALACRGDDLRALGALEELLAGEERWAECIEVIEARAALIDAPEDRVDLLLRAASLLQERLEDEDGAARVYESILQLEPTNDGANCALLQSYRVRERWEQLVELLLAHVQRAESASERIERLQEVARIYETHLKQPEAAFMVWQAAFKEDYSNEITVKELERLASATDKWNELLAECQNVVHTVHDPQIRADLLVNMGIWYADLGHLEYAIESARGALQICPESTRALTALSSFYRKTGQWQELVQVLHRAQEIEEETDRRAEILISMGETFERYLQDDPQALSAYRSAFEINKDDERVLDALERLNARTGDWESVVSVLSRKADLEVDPDRVIEIKLRIGEAHETQTDDSSRAIDVYRDVLLTDAQNLVALGALERLYEKTGQTEAYLDVLEQELDIAGEDRQRISLYQRMAGAWEEQFHKLDRAAECLEKILLIDPSNVAAYQDLERFYLEDGRYEDLVETLRRHINAVQDIPERIALYLRMGNVYEHSLAVTNRAIEAYSDVLSFDADNVDALSALAHLYEQTEDWERAVEVMSRLVTLVEDMTMRVDLLFRLGRAHEEYLDDNVTAEERYSDALGLDENHVESMKRLIGLYRTRGDWAKAARMMVRAAEGSTSQVDQSRLYYEAGQAYATQLNDNATANSFFAQTLAVDPDHVQAGEPLAEAYLAEERYGEVEPILEMLLRKTDTRNTRRVHELNCQLAQAAAAQGKDEQALSRYEAAYTLDSSDLTALRGMADLLFRMEVWERAFKIYQTILVHHRDSGDHICEIFYRLGEIKLKTGDRKKALNMFEKALESDPRHRPTIMALIQIEQEEGNWEGVVAAKQKMLSMFTAPEAERDQPDQEYFDLLIEIGTIQNERLNNPEQAIACFRDALKIQPGNRQVLHWLTEIYSAVGQWKRAVEVISELAASEASAAVRARYLYAAAVILRDEVKSLDEALDLFDRSLDETWSTIDDDSTAEADHFKAFEAQDRICTQKKDWKNQERYYRKMIKRLPAEGCRMWKIRLWHALGEIYRTRLRDMASAIAAFEIAAQLEPENPQRHEILAELFVLSGPEGLAKAALEHQALIQQDPDRLPSYRALRQIYMDTKRYDRAWCVCAALAFLKQANEEELSFYEEHRSRSLVRAQAKMSDEFWRKIVFHSDEDIFISAIFGVCAPSVAQISARPHKAYGLKRKERVDLASDQLLFTKVLNYVSSLFGVSECDLFVSKKTSGLEIAHTIDRPSFVVGRDLLSGRPEKDLAFILGRQLSYLRPEHYLHGVLRSSAHLRTVFLAALKLTNPALPVPNAEVSAVDGFVSELKKRMPLPQQEQLDTLVRKFFETHSGAVDLSSWLAAVELGADRAAFLCVNDLEVASRMFGADDRGVGSGGSSVRMKEIIRFSTSEAYLTAREQLGLVVV